MNSEHLLKDLRDGRPLPFRNQVLLIIQLSIPAMLAQISTVLMEYIDASMVGSLGANASASIGLIASTTWLMGNLVNAAAMGFNVQIAQYIGAKKNAKARDIFRQGIEGVLVIGLVLAVIGAGGHNWLPVFLGGDEAIVQDAAAYFLIYALAIPLQGLVNYGSGALQSTGNMTVAGVLLVMMCTLDVIYNFFMIFPTRALSVLGFSLTVPGAGLGVAGAALGTVLAEITIGIIGFGYIMLRSDELSLTKRRTEEEKAKAHAELGDAQSFLGFRGQDIRNTVRIALPIAFESTVMCLAQIAQTKIVAPLGTIAIAANSLAVTAESLCYMPGYGVGSAATTLIGQSIGADRRDLVRRLGWLTTIFGSLVMTVSGVAMYILAPYMIGLLTPDESVRALGTMCLRIEAFAEPMFGASIIANGVFRGAGDTLAPSILALISMWAVRIPIAAILAPRIGLRGVWLAMCIELTCRGIFFLIRLAGKKWSRGIGLSGKRPEEEKQITAEK